MRNPLYHWTHMELKNPFEVDYLLNPKSAEFIYDFVGEKINDWSTNTILNHFKVEVVGTTDDPCDSLHSVSYTHLDVYKRQGISCANCFLKV